ncbi:glycosyltransferase family 2 protein [Aequorivita xiaoshiensis]|uniref:Glycosyltransferase family 2 protein n=1 Tax=Aequorivita xiaoshiensis TaxID=2874476 RepID=A0A9X1R1F1_9FLAO|nr:glycosyltransferase family 2 protein [Aequorivita xiaoshiensis]MCG2431688.1 glycosyltransferase family 2 protein [Aequorivita xiaoshiensis]
MKTLTVFTPTYNRAHLLSRLYKSLCNQTNKDFVWLVIDDGSIDNTSKIVSEWLLEGKIEIEYRYKENGGMHTGHNLAYKLIKTELNVCIDSDDYMPDKAVEKILDKWNACKIKKIAGIVGLDATEDGEIIGSKLPEIAKGNFIDIYEKYKCSGDKKVVLKSDIVKQFPPYPEYKNEKLVPLGCLYNLIGSKYDFIYENEVYCIVEYQDEGSSHSIFKQYKQSPRGFAYARKLNNKFSKSVSIRLKNAIHIGSSAIFSKDLRILSEKNRTFLNVMVFPLSIILNIYVRYKISNK